MTGLAGVSRQRVAVTGAGGLVGFALCQELSRGPWAASVEVVGVIRRSAAQVGVESVTADLADPDVGPVLDGVRADLWVHCAYANTDADIVDATRAVVDSAGRTSATVVLLSTDAVFGGTDAPYSETCTPDPITDYGRRKVAAEGLVLSSSVGCVVRTSLVVSVDPPDGATRWLIDSCESGLPVTLFTDEIRTPVLLDDLVQAVAEIVALSPTQRSGIWHVGGPERRSRAELGNVLISALDLPDAFVSRIPKPTDSPPRPSDVSLSSDRMLASLSVRPRAVGTVLTHGRTGHRRNST